MNGPTHFREAETYVAIAGKVLADSAEGAETSLQFAQVHATLALVALLVDTHASRIQPRDLIAEWAEATR